MVTPTVRIMKTVKVASLVDAVGVLAKKEALVGIPAENSSRQNPSDDGINNAELLYIQSHGSPLWHIPPRPVLEPSVEANKEPIAKQLQGAVTASIDGNKVGVDQALHRAGFVAENAAKRWFEDPKNGWPPNSPRTIAQKGSDSPLIDTGEMRKSITHVVRDRGEANE